MPATAYRRIAAFDARTGGPATIAGTVKVLTNPVSCPVYLMTQGGLALRRVVQSASDGTYTFAKVAANTQWLVLAIDPAGAYNAVVADRVQT